MRIGIGLGIGGRRRGGAATWRANFYVDSVNGSDANNGLTEATAFATWVGAMPSILAYGAGVKIGAARNALAGPWDAHWREMPDFSTVTGVEIRGYGDPSLPMPKISAADIAPASGFTLVAGKANVHQITWTHSIPADYGKNKICAWKAGVRLKWVASVDLCEAEANTFHVATGAIANPATVYMHVSGAGNPGTGDDCEITARAAALIVGPLDDSRDVHTTKQAGHDGSFIGGTAGHHERILMSEGVVHNCWSGVASTNIDCWAYEMEPSTWRSLPGTMFVAYSNGGSTSPTRFIGGGCYSSAPAGNLHEAIYAHTTGGANRHPEVIVDGFMGYGPNPSITVADTDILSVSNTFLELLPGRPSSAVSVGATTGSYPDTKTVSNNVTILNAARAFGLGGIHEVTDARVYVNGIVSGGLFFGTAKLRNSTFVFAPGLQGFESAMFNPTGSATEVFDTVISDAGDMQLRAASATSVTSDRNVFYAEGAFGNFAIGASTNLQFTAGWKAQTGEDANSAAIANTGLPICADAPNGDFTLVRTIVDEGGRTAGSRKNIERPDWSAMVAAWEAGFIAPV